jgi:plastocyanin
MRDVTTATLLSSALMLSACGGSGSEGNGRAKGVAGVPDGSAFVDQHSLKFNPKALAVSASEPVYFKNSDTTFHTVSVNGKNQSGTMKAGDVFSWKAPGQGEYKISCEFHPQMKATVTVGP